MIRRAACVAVFFWCSGGMSCDAQTIRMDLQQTDQQILGFGGQIWAGDARGRAALVELGARFARLQHGVNFFTFAEQPPTDLNQTAGDNFAAMKNYIAANFNGPGGSEPWHLPAIKSTQTWAKANNVALIVNEFQIAYGFLDAAHTTMTTSRVDDYATFWGAMLSFLADNNVHPAYIELANEPNGAWNGRIPAADYNALVAQTRRVLDDHGFGEVGIVGPGLNVLGDTSWIEALDSAGVDSLAGWSTHAWDDSQGVNSRASLFESAVKAKDPDKPVFITEYATSITEFNGNSYGSPESGGNAADQPAFAVRVFENTLSLVNHGASALILWEAADQSWSDKRWGLKREDGTDRPTLAAMKTLLDVLPDDATALDLTWNDPEITAAGFLKDGNLIVALANSLNNNESRTLDLANASGVLQFQRGLQFRDGIVAPVEYAVSGRSVSVELPAESAQTLVFKILPPEPGDFDRNGAVDHNDLLRWAMEYGMIGGTTSDADFDGDADGRDFLLWQRNVTLTSAIATAASAAPEPSAVWLMTVAVLSRSGRRAYLATTPPGPSADQLGDAANCGTPSEESAELECGASAVELAKCR